MLATIEITTSLTITPDSSLQGKSFSVNGTITLANKQLNFEIQAVPNGGGAYTITFDDNLAIGAPIQFVFVLNAVPKFIANALTFSGLTTSGFYSDFTDSSHPVSSQIVSASGGMGFISATAGSSVTGSLAFNLANGTTIQGNFTGKFGAIQ